MAITTYPLPRVGLCPECGDEVRLRTNNRVYVHDSCPGAGEFTAPLPPTFLRWVWSHRGRRDSRTHPITQLAEFTVGLSYGCRYRQIALVPWTSAEELHDFKHTLPRAPGCDWLCQDIRQAADIYDRLLVDPACQVEPGIETLAQKAARLNVEQAPA